MYSRTLLAYLSAISSFVVVVTAQHQPAQCSPGWDWNQNSLGQDPCEIATILDSNCRNDPTYIYQKINTSEWYIPPSKTHFGDMSCDCDTVMYSLVMACSTCQGGIAYGWDAWTKQCDTVLISDYSGNIPQGTAIPHWAFYNVTLLNKEQFDNSNAQTVGRNPEAKPNAPKPSSTSGGGKGISKKTAAIVGGVVGGIGFLIIVISAYFVNRWWRSNRERNLQGQWDNAGGCDYGHQWKTPPQSPTSQYTPSVSTIPTLSAVPNLSTGPTLSPNRSFQSHLPQPMPGPHVNQAVTWVTPISGGGRR